jgi:serine protease AprX
MRRILAIFIFLFAFGSPLAAHPKKFDSELQKKTQKSKGKGNANGNQKVKVIITTTGGDPDAAGVSDHVRKHQGKVLGKFRHFPGIVVEMPLSALENAADHSAVGQISLDEQVTGFALPFDLSSLSVVDVNRLVTGAPQAWSQYGVVGSGIGVAIIDSGITASSDVVTKMDVDFTGNNNPSDRFGHGTHVAGIVGGSGAMSNRKFIGAAPGVNLVNLRVLNENGVGYTSSVIQAIEWAIQNRNAIGRDGKPLNIRVINLSLGHKPYESAETDPLAIACRKAVMAGIVVVAAAGNYGKDEDGRTVFGGIASPGTEPSVITVGAISTFNSISRSDDVVASYSSRGPSIDGFIKPDISAPGTRIIAPMSPGNTLVDEHSQLIYNSSYMRLSGTSMAAPFVSAAAALILQKNPGLKPNAVKAILMYTAEKRNRNPLTMGAGYLNALGAVNLAANINASAPISSYWLLNNGSNLNYANDIFGYRATWSSTIVWEDTLYWHNAIQFNQKAWGSTIVWGDTIVWEELALVLGTTIVWESDVAAFNVEIGGLTIVWEALTALNAGDIDVEW